MAISPPTDIILDVARAADPERLKAATGRLARLAGEPEAADFGVVLDAAGSAAVAVPPTSAAPAPPSGAGRSATAAGRDAHRDFEAMALASFIESALPARADAVFGTGTAGSVWKSMLAREIAAGLARSGGIGIARMVAAAEAGGAATVAVQADPGAGLSVLAASFAKPRSEAP